ncbi:hypothetical protein [Halomarina litorea]|uniref:hypothetical protein n=1 Tax=Halomarina litorea TaxID=2961595 RepID=UPI0020C3452B|nr:hypothetical protein [Halomarina sp. BCD28]
MSLIHALPRVRSADTDESDPGRSDRPGSRLLARSALRGTVGGLIATLVMTLYRAPVFRTLPPTAEVWAKYVAGGEAEDHQGVGLLLHLLYGTVAGALFGPVFHSLDGRTPLSRDHLGAAGGLAFGLLLSAFGSRVLMPYVAGTALDDDERLVFHVGHVVYGLTLGTWVATRRRMGEVYD